MLKSYRILVAIFSVTDKINQIRFLEKTFLLANISLEVVVGMLFLILSNTNVDFLDWEL